MIINGTLNTNQNILFDVFVVGDAVDDPGDHVPNHVPVRLASGLGPSFVTIPTCNPVLFSRFTLMVGRDDLARNISIYFLLGGTHLNTITNLGDNKWSPFITPLRGFHPRFSR